MLQNMAQPRILFHHAKKSSSWYLVPIIVVMLSSHDLVHRTTHSNMINANSLFVDHNRSAISFIGCMRFPKLILSLEVQSNLEITLWFPWSIWDVSTLPSNSRNRIQPHLPWSVSESLETTQPYLGIGLSNSLFSCLTPTFMQITPSFCS